MKMLVLSLAACSWLGCAWGSSTQGAARVARASDAHPSDALAARGLELLERGDYVRAEQYLQAAARSGGSEAELIVPLLQSCIASNRLRSALAHAERHLARHPDAAHVRYVRSAILRALDQPLAAQATANERAPSRRRRPIRVHGARP
jgi:outer membrane protein assembly factor BamD (BamD/ComL family)